MQLILVAFVRAMDVARGVYVRGISAFLFVQFRGEEGFRFVERCVICLGQIHSEAADGTLTLSPAMTHNEACAIAYAV